MSGDDIGTTGLRSVAEVLRGGRPASADAVALAAAAAAAVATLHAAGQVHGHLDPEHVLVDDAGAVVLSGPAPRRIGPAAPPELCSADRRAVGRILALGLGWTVPDRALPAPVEDLLTRAESAGTPSVALARALRRLQRDPALIAALLPPVPVVVAARPREDHGPLAALVPRGARRTALVATGFVAGAALVGGALLLVGAPGGIAPAPHGTGRAVAAPRPAATAAPFQDLAAIDPDASSLDRLLRTSPTPVPRPAARRPARPAAPAVQPRAQAVRPAPARPAAASTGASGSGRPTSTPAQSAPTSTAPSAPARTASARPTPTPPVAPAPTPTRVVPSAAPAPSAPSAPSSPAPQRTTSAGPGKATPPPAG